MSDKLQDLIEFDVEHIWHPAAQMKDYESFPPICIEKAQGPYTFFCILS